MDILLSLDTWGSGLVLPQLDMPDIADFPWKVLLFLRCEYRWGKVEVVGGGEGGGTMGDI